MKTTIAEFQKTFETDIKQALKSNDLEDLRVKYLGKKGIFNSLMQELRTVSKEERPAVGKYINELKTKVSSRLDEQFEVFRVKELEERLAEETIDVSLPGRQGFVGSKHPISAMLEDVFSILSDMGFSVYATPEVESEFYNYGGLNYPEEHPARDMQDTYYFDKETLLRSHTTNFQQRVMEHYDPPIRVCSGGKCFRNETISSRSHVVFHQTDVLYIDKGVTFADLLATLEEFYTRLFEQKVKIRVRASYFPFVEPGVEVDVSCTLCNGKGCRLCKDTGWLEVCGAGMVHPEVLIQGGLDPEVYSGFAWGGGIERVHLLKNGINDIRLYLENDTRFLSQFP